MSIVRKSTGNGVVRALVALCLMLSAGVGVCWAEADGNEAASETPAAAPAESPLSPAVQAMLEGLLSDETPARVRRGNAEALLLDAQAYPALIDVLSRPDHVEAKKIVCQAIAGYRAEFLSPAGVNTVPNGFIDPLFELLLSDQQELSFWAAQALARCRDGVVERVAALVNNAEESVEHRLAGIEGLALMAGRGPVLALAPLLGQDNAPLRARAAVALGQMLGLEGAVEPEVFLQRYLPVLEQMSEEEFLRWQLTLQQKRLEQTQVTVAQGSAQAQAWRERCFAAWTRQLEGLEPAARLEQLARFLGDADPAVQAWALESILAWCRAAPTQTGPLAGQLAELLKGFIGNGQPHLRATAARVLATLGGAAATLAEPLLTQLGKETSAAAQAAQLQALGVFEYVPALEQAVGLLGAETAVAEEAARALGRICNRQGQGGVSAEQAAQVAAALAAQYNARPQAANLRRELLQAMTRMTDVAAFGELARQHFDPIFREALADPDGALRRLAVYALTRLHEAKVLPLLLGEPNLLNDPDTRVRFAVIEAVHKYGGRAELEPLYARLGQETEPEAVEAIRLAFRDNLGRLNTEDAYVWATRLKDAPAKERPLRQEVLRLLAEKIAQDRAADRPVPAAYEIEAYRQYGRLAEQDGQFAAAVGWYAKLAQLPELGAEAQPLVLQAVTLALEHDQDGALLAQVQPLVGRLGAPALALIDQACQQAAEQPLRAARMVAVLVAPLEAYPTPELQQHWRALRRETALRLVEQQQGLLAAAEGKENMEAIRLLALLDGRLTPYPGPDQPIEQRRAALARFKQILEGAAAAPASQAPAAAPATPPAAG